MNRFLATIPLLLMLAACTNPSQTPAEVPDQVYQYSTIKALLEGGYDGDMTLGELATKGDFGIGTFNKLDGEMVVLDGTFYQVKTDGVASEISPEMKTPFVVLTHFEADTSFALTGKMDFEALLKSLDEAISTKNLFYAIRIDGEFKGLKTRSVRAQSKPYRPLGEVIGGQAIFPFEVTEGSMVGFCFPDYTSEINVPGYHLHYLNDERKKGGHVLALEEITAMVSIDFIPNLYMALPASGDFHNLDLSKDRTEDLDKVEKLRN